MDLLAPLLENTDDGRPVIAWVDRTGMVPAVLPEPRSIKLKLLSGRSLQRTGLRSVFSVISSVMA